MPQNFSMQSLISRIEFFMSNAMDIKQIHTVSTEFFGVTLFPRAGMVLCSAPIFIAFLHVILGMTRFTTDFSVFIYYIPTFRLVQDGGMNPNVYCEGFYVPLLQYKVHEQLFRT